LTPDTCRDIRDNGKTPDDLAQVTGEHVLAQQTIR
jgi:hypothetical protein